MNPEEQRRLTHFLDELGKVRGVTRDPEADALIGAATRQQPDAVYLLVQRCLLQDQALQAANARIEALQQSLAQAQSRPPRPEGGLLGANPWGRASPPSSPPAAGPLAPFGQPAASPVSGWLGNAMATAAGVAGGAFLFHGIESLLHGHHPDPGRDDLAWATDPSGEEFTQPADSPEHADFSTARFDDADSGFGDDDDSSLEI